MSGHEENTKKTKDTVSEPKFYNPQAATGRKATGQMATGRMATGQRSQT